MIIVIGGGPAGFFGALAAREVRPDCPVMILEKAGKLLRKVAVSGGGRCNVTHNCTDPREMAGRYPRGARELIGPFTHWGVSETIEWFADRGVPLHSEADGRMFPVTNTSSTIVDCLRDTATHAGIDVRTRQAVTEIAPVPSGGFQLTLDDLSTLECDRVLLATGGQSPISGESRSVGGYELARSLGHEIIPPVPSLFTFNLTDKSWAEMAGLAVDPVSLRVKASGLPKKGLVSDGPLLFTHWGLSGPAVLKLSAFGARAFHDLDYRFELEVEWLPTISSATLAERFQNHANVEARKAVHSANPTDLPKRLWRTLAEAAGIPDTLKWSDLGKKPRLRMLELLKNTRFQVDGKSTFKEEFVTCGGVSLKEVDLRTMESRVQPGLFLAGEVLDIDGITGGYNFQAAWTTGRLAGLGGSDSPD